MAFEGSKTLAEQIAKHLADRIIRSELLPGERILEAKLAEELDVSRSPIREAFRMLEKSKLLEVSPHRGARVTEMSRTTTIWVFEILTELTALMAKRVAESRSDEDILRLRDGLKKFEECAATGDSEAYYQCFFDWVGVLREMAKNPLLAEVLKDFEPTLGRILYGTFAHQSDDLKENVKFVQRIICNIEDGNPDMAAAAARDYANNERDIALRTYVEGDDPDRRQKSPNPVQEPSQAG